jgi:Mrp family chromosome partitioning ATPase
VANKRPRRRHRGLSTARRGRSASGEALVLRSEGGELLHVSLPPVTSTLRATIARLRLADQLPQRLGVVSAIRGEGVTFISRSLALVLANDTGKDVCMVDLNWRAPAKWNDEIDGGRGLADVLRGSLALTEALVPTDNPALWILPAGEASLEEGPIFASSSELNMVLEDVDRRFDYVILDLPALHVASEALTLAAEADAVAVVVRQGVTPEGQVKAALEELDGVPVLGVILNAYSTNVPNVIMRRVPPA